MNILFKIFFTFFKIGMFSFGGGLTMLPFIKKEIVDSNHWIDFSTFTDIIGIAQMTPGPIAINSATFVGFKVKHIYGSIFATLGVITFSFVLVSIASHYVIKFKNSKLLKSAILGMRPAVIGLISSAFIFIAKSSYSLKDIKSIFLGGIVGVLLLKTKLHPILVIAFSGILGIIFYH